MTKTDFAKKLQATINIMAKKEKPDNPELASLSQVLRFLDVFEQTIDIQLSQEGKVNLGIGCFKVAKSKPRKVKHPTTGQMIDIPAKTKIKYIPSSKLLHSIEMFISVNSLTK